MKRAVILLVSAAALFGVATHARAGGFALEEQSVSGLGNAFAGGAASAEDASTVFFNPAGLTLLKGQNAAAGGQLIVPHAKFQKDEARHATGAPLTGGDGGDAGEPALIPNAYYSVTFESGLALGFGLSVPFGLASDYAEDWVGRYHATRSEMSATSLTPCVAYRVTPAWSVGAGLVIQRLEAELSNRVDFGFILALAGVPGFAPQSADGEATLTGDHWGYGYAVGTIYEFGRDSRIGFAYRSRVKHKVEGRADFDLPEGLPPQLVQALAAEGFRDTDAEVSITLPDSASLSFYHRLSPRWVAMADVTWTNWSIFDELRVHFAKGLADDVTTENWKDAWRFAVGLNYTPTPVWTWRAGVAYDQDPIPDAEHRTPRVPSSDRIWTTFGFGYRPVPWLGVDFGYAHLFLRDARIDKKISGLSDEDAPRGVLKGEFEVSADIVSAQLTARF